MTTPVGSIDTLRPDTLDKYVGQRDMVRRLRVRIDAARNIRAYCAAPDGPEGDAARAAAVEKVRPLDHFLLCGPAGVGKTSLAGLVAKAVGDPFMALQMPVALPVLARAVAEFEGVLFLEEIHRLKGNQEWLLPLLEFGNLHLPNGTVIHNGWLTVVGATTERDQILGPLWDRFIGGRPVYAAYSLQELTRIAAGMAAKLELALPDDLLAAVGRASGGVPRNVRTIMLEARNLVTAYGRTPTVEQLLDQAGVTADGLTESHIEYLVALHALSGSDGRAVGLSRLRSMIRQDESVLLDLERLLIERQLVTFGDRGRQLTQAGRARAKAAA